MVASVPFAATRDGMRLAIRATPKSSADRILGLIADGRGGAALKVAVTAPAEDGRANAALVKLLARELVLKPGDVTVMKGMSTRSKVIAIAGDPARLAPMLRERLSRWLIQD